MSEWNFVLHPFNVGLNHYLLVGALLFAIGLYGVLAKRQFISILLSIEIMLNAVNINLVAFNKFMPMPDATGELFAIFVIVVAAVELALGLALCITLYQQKKSIQADKFDVLKW